MKIPTGFFDKNNKPIFNGDKLTIPRNLYVRGSRQHYVGTVKIDEKSDGTRFIVEMIDPRKCEDKALMSKSYCSLKFLCDDKESELK